MQKQHPGADSIQRSSRSCVTLLDLGAGSGEIDFAELHQLLQDLGHNYKVSSGLIFAPSHLFFLLSPSLTRSP
eukprot:566483-Rhodomonas_salina.1